MASLAAELVALKDQIASLRVEASAVLRHAAPTPVYELTEARRTSVAFATPPSARDLAPAAADEGFFGGLLDEVRIQWLTGRWNDLAQIDLRQIETHPARARLALFGAVGWMSRNDPAQATTYLQAALRYGCPKSLVSRVLLAGAHAGLAKAYTLAGRDRPALHHQDALRTIVPQSRLGFQLPAARASVDAGAAADMESEANLSPRVLSAASRAVAAEHPTEAVAQALRQADFTTRERFLFLREVARRFFRSGNSLLASGFVAESSQLLESLPEDYRWSAVKEFLTMNLRDEAFEVALRGIGTQTVFSPEERRKLAETRDAMAERIYDFKGHGHEVLLAFLSRDPQRIGRAKGGEPPVLVEIGTTRESAAGQGSTRRLMDFCRKHGWHFITVDMDSVNAQMAALMFRENGLAFEAVHGKGEDFLAAYEGGMDAVFLDAYDFDHGKHTELRQSRYEKFLGARISDQDCHQMHLECAQAIAAKLNPWTVVCVDDTWLDAGSWTAKGTLAMPYLLDQGLRLLDVRNRSALLGGSDWFFGARQTP